MKPDARFRMVLRTIGFLIGWIAATGIGWAVQPPAGTITLQLVETARVSGPEILLKDIARLTCSDPQQAKALGRLAVAKSPLPGQSRRLRARFVLLRLRQFGIEPDHITLAGAPATMVTARSREVDQEQIRQIASEYVHRSNLWGSEKVTITDIQIGSDRLFPPGRLSYRVVAPNGPRQVGLLRLSILFEVDGWFRKTVPVAVRMDVMTDVVVARRPIGRYKPITDRDVKLQRLDRTELPAHIFTDLSDVIGKRARRPIQANSVVRQDMIETPPMVQRGSMVLIVAETGGLKVTTLGEVKSSGYRGQRVKVLNLDSKKKIFARVVDENTVQVDF